MPDVFAGRGYYLWAGDIQYQAGDIVIRNFGVYLCPVTHISSASFIGDVVAGYWTPAGFGVGDIKSTAGVRSVAQPGFLLTNGASYLRADYPDLFGVLTATQSCTLTIAAPGVVTAAAHGLSTGSRISFETSGSLPTGLVAGTNYYAIRIDANTFFVASTYATALAGAKITTSGSQSGTQTLRNNPWGVPDLLHFSVPDFRGLFLKGTGQQGYAAWSTADYVSFIGQYYQDVMQGHKHALDHTHGSVTTGGRSAYHQHTLVTGAFGSSGSSVVTGAASQSSYATGNDNADHTHSVTIGAFTGDTGVCKTDGSHGTPRTATVTEPASAGVLFSIKY